MVRRTIAHAAVLGMVLVPGMAFAAGAKSATGEIQSVDAAKHEIVLKDGKTFEAPKVNVGKLKAGTKVTVTYEEKNGKLVASKVKAGK